MLLSKASDVLSLFFFVCFFIFVFLSKIRTFDFRTVFLSGKEMKREVETL